MDYEAMYTDLLAQVVRLSDIIPKIKSLAKNDAEALDIVSEFVDNIVYSEYDTIDSHFENKDAEP